MEKPTQPRIGILGEGQLALMLSDAGSQLGFDMHCFCTHSPAPAQLSSASCYQGSYDSPKDLQKFLKNVDILTIESEFVPTEKIQKSLLDFPAISTCPLFENVDLVKNKLNQKHFFQKLQIPTSEFKAFSPEFDDLTIWLPQTLKDLGPLVLKASEGGYDGKGNFIFKEESQINLALEFCENILKKNSNFYAEKFVDFQNEVAMVYVRSTKGEFINYPLSITQQSQNICERVYGPATSFGISPELESQALELGKFLAEHLGFIGAFALEFFICNGKIMINEMAPRVHNSGHYTQINPESSQFSNHIRAIAGVDLVKPEYGGCFYMKNLLAPQDHPVDLAHGKRWGAFSSQNAQVHWYGKTQSRQFRKMGHINTTMDSADDLKQMDLELNKLEQELWSKIYE